MPFHNLEHTADLYMEACGESREQAVEESLHALTELVWGGEMLRNASRNERGAPLRHDLRGETGLGADGMVELLNELLYLLQTDSLLPLRFQVKAGEQGFTARLDAARAPAGERREEIKAVTYHRAELLAPSGPGGAWIARWIADV